MESAVPGEGVEPSRGCPRRFLRAPPQQFGMPARANLGRRVFGRHVDRDAVCRCRVRADSPVGVRVGVLGTSESVIVADSLASLGRGPRG